MTPKFFHLLPLGVCVLNAFLCVSLLCSQTLAPEMRIWTSTDGRTIQAKLTGVEGDQAVFELSNGQTAKVPVLRLSPADQTVVQQSAGGALKAVPANDNPVAASGKTPPEKRVWPVIVEVPSSAVDIKAVEENAAEHKYVYESATFQFSSQDKLAGSVMKEVARTFEATHSLVQALPWGIDATPPPDLGFYQAKLYVNRDEYIKDGGPKNSGGVYFSSDRIFRIPFESMGLEMRGKTWFKKPSYKEATLVHEVTHQMMNDFLPFLPTWVIEGTAEYTEAIPYNAGKFLAGAHERAVKEYIKHWTDHKVLTNDFRPAGDHMVMKHAQWVKLSETPHAQWLLYYQSYMLVYYFCHLDGDCKGTRFLKYLDAVAKARDDWATFFKNPAVKKGIGGRFSYPANLPLPEAKRSEEFGMEKLGILFDGRSPSQFDAEVKAGFKKIGVKL